MHASLDRYFRLRERGSSVRIEVIGGATTFITMAYIIVVNPAILGFAGIPAGPSTMATILTAVFGCALMGLYANRPIAVAPYMGENAFIAFGLAALGIGWQQRLASVFVAGILFLLVALLRVRGWLFHSISTSMKHSFAAGIGLFLALIGLYETGIVTSFVTGMPAAALPATGGILKAPDVPLKIGNLHDPAVLLAIAGFVIIAALLHRRVPGAILVGMAITAAGGVALHLAHPPTGILSTPFVGHYSLAPIAFKMDLAGILSLVHLPILVTLFLMSFLDTLGTLVGVSTAGNMLDAHGNFPDVERPMTVDALSCMFAAAVGTSTSGAYIESAAGMREGARTGLASLVTAGLFLLAAFFLPLVEPLQQARFVYGPALIAVGVMMVGSLRHIDFNDVSEAAPAFATITVMVFTYNIANGLTAGLILYPVIKLLSGRVRDVTPGAWVLAALCAVYYLFGLPH